MLSTTFPSIRNSLQTLAEHTREAVGSLPTFGGVRTVTWVGIGLMLVALVYLAQFSNAALLARSLRVKQDRIAELQRENAQLRFEIAAATSPSSIEARAKQLGLAPAKTVVYANLPALRPDRAEVLVSFAPNIVPMLSTVAPTPWDELRSMFGFGNGDRVQAGSN